MIKQIDPTIKTASATLTAAEIGEILCDSTSAQTYTLPTVSPGLWYRLININTGAVTIGDITLEQNQTCICVNDKTDWHIIEGGIKSLEASKVAVEDSDGHFTETDLEGVLGELFTFANSGKTDIASAIGTSEASSADSFSSLAGYITTDKGTMASNLTAKGVTASSSETLAALAAKIADIAASGGGGVDGVTTPETLTIPIPVMSISASVA